LDLKKLKNDKDKDLNTNDFYDDDCPLFQIFWYKNIFQNFRLITAELKEDGTILINKLFITIDLFQNKTKYAKIEIKAFEGDTKRHLTQKIYKYKCTLKKFQKEIEAYNENFKILPENDIFSKPPSKDVYIVAQNNKGNIKRYVYIYDKETYECFEESLEGADDDFYATSNSTTEKIPMDLAEKVKDKIFDLVECINEESRDEPYDENCDEEEGEEENNY